MKRARAPSNVRESLIFGARGTRRIGKRRPRRCDETLQGSDSRSATRLSYLTKVGRATPSEACSCSCKHHGKHDGSARRNTPFFFLPSTSPDRDSWSDFIRSLGRAQLPRGDHEFMTLSARCQVTMRRIVASESDWSRSRLINTLIALYAIIARSD